MKHVYKSGGDRVSPRGDNYTIKVVNNDEFYDYLANGWFASLEDATSIEGTLEEGSDYEAELREKIKALGGKAGGSSSIETLEKQLKELEDGSDN